MKSRARGRSTAERSCSCWPALGPGEVIEKGTQTTCSQAWEAEAPTIWVEFEVGGESISVPVDELVRRFDEAHWRMTTDDDSPSFELIEANEQIPSANVSADQDGRLGVTVSLTYQYACYDEYG